MNSRSECKQVIRKEAGGITVTTFIDGIARRTVWTADKRWPTKKQLAAERDFALAGSQDFMVSR